VTVNALIIAASDPSGGAGIEADIKVMAAHRVFALTAITAVTVQDTRGVREVMPVDLEVFRRVLDLHRADRPISAVKIGALATSGHLEAVREFLAGLDPLPPVVLDPVISATSGAELLDKDGQKMMVKSLLPYAALVTPNLNEAKILAGGKVEDLEGMKEAARKLCEMGAAAVLVKGGHLKGEPSDALCVKGEIQVLTGERLAREFHGTGCALASAIAAGLAKGMELTPAIEAGRKYLARCMESARPGSGEAWILDFPPAE
jgi:hydroxymethylpyrimidine/phosphomethylpyrimidine kinase